MDSNIRDNSVQCMMCPKLTLFLAGFMLLLLISYPLILESSLSTTAVPYLIYSSFLTSVGVLIGVSTIWLNSTKTMMTPLTNPIESKYLETGKKITLDEDVIPPPSTKRIHLTENERWVVDFLTEEGGKCWQSELVEKSQMTPSKISRTLTKMEARGMIERIRDGMGKRVVLTEVEVL